jgi:hypothetical protein
MICGGVGTQAGGNLISTEAVHSSISCPHLLSLGVIPRRFAVPLIWRAGNPHVFLSPALAHQVAQLPTVVIPGRNPPRPGETIETVRGSVESIQLSDPCGKQRTRTATHRVPPRRTSRRRPAAVSIRWTRCRGILVGITCGRAHAEGSPGGGGDATADSRVRGRQQPQLVSSSNM